MHVQSLKRSMKGDGIESEFEMLVRKQVTARKESLLETFDSKQKKLQKETDNLKKENCELRVQFENIM